MKLYTAIITFLSISILYPLSCAAEKTENVIDSAPVIADAVELVAVLIPTKGNTASGVVAFKPLKNNQVEVTGKVWGLDPRSKHGFHIHQYGDLTSSDGSSAGDHYNPMGHSHALPPQKPRHAGDLGNITANSKGIAKFRIVVDNISLAGRKSPIIGRGLVVHARPDDGSQPAGNAGERIAVGVIGVRNLKNSHE